MNERTITLTEWIEAKCPYCRYVYYSILKDIQVRRIELNRKLVKQGHLPMPKIEIKLIDVEANKGCKEMQWFDQYSQKIGGVFTPAVRVGNIGKVFYLWGKDKDRPLSEKELSASAKLKSEILQEIQDILERVDRDGRFYDRDLYNPASNMKLVKPRMIYTPHGGFNKSIIGG
jgi:hypothetical protein